MQDQAGNLLARKGRAYWTSNKKYAQLQLYSTSELDMRMLVAVFGGNYGIHQSGYQWYLSSRKGIANAARIARPFCYGNSYKRLEAMFDVEIALLRTEESHVTALAG